MNRINKSSGIILIATLLAVCGNSVEAQLGVIPQGMVVENINIAVSPSVHFYYSNSWLANNQEIVSNPKRESFDERGDKNSKNLKVLLENCANRQIVQELPRQLIGDYFPFSNNSNQIKLMT